MSWEKLSADNPPALKQPLVKGALLLTGGILLASRISLSYPQILIFLGICLAGALIQAGFSRRLTQPWPRFFLALTIIGIGFLRMRICLDISPDHISHLANNAPALITGIVKSAPVIRRHSIRFDLSVSQLKRAGQEIPVRGMVRVTFHGNTALARHRIAYGNLLEVATKPAPPPQAGNPAGFCPARHLANQGIFTVARVYDPADIRLKKTGQGEFLTATGLKIREKMGSLIDQSLPTPTGSPGGIFAILLRAILLGERDNLPPLIRENFRQAGVLHTLVVSGLHVGFIWFFGNLALSSFSLRLRHSLIIPLVLGYVLITGARPPAVRAGLMASLYSLGFVLNQPARPWSALAGAGTILLLYNPLNLLGIGFQLSFLIITAILALAGRLLYFFKKLPVVLAETLAVLLAAQIGVLPLSAFYFHEIHPWALISNLIIVPLVGIIASLGFVSMICGLIWEMMAWIFNYPNRYLILGLLKLVGFSSRLPAATVILPYCPAGGAFGLYLALFIISQIRPKRKKIPLILAGSCLIIGIIISFFPESQTSQALFFNGPSGEFVLLRQGTGTILIAPDDDPFKEVEQILLPYLFKEKVDVLDLLVLSRRSCNRLGTLKELLKQVRVQAVVSAPDKKEAATELAWRRLLKKHGILWRKVKAKEKLKVKKIFLKILWPPQSPPPDGEGVISVLATMGGCSLLLPGDIGPWSQEVLILRHDDLAPDLIKLPHRGRKNLVSRMFLEKLHPRWVVIQQGRPAFGRYSADTGSFFEKTGAQVYRTSKYGAIRFDFRRGRAKITTGLGNTTK